jgi:hypothetical protein
VKRAGVNQGDRPLCLVRASGMPEV